MGQSIEANGYHPEEMNQEYPILFPNGESIAISGLSRVLLHTLKGPNPEEILATRDNPVSMIEIGHAMYGVYDFATHDKIQGIRHGTNRRLRPIGYFIDSVVEQKKTVGLFLTDLSSKIKIPPHTRSTKVSQFMDPQGHILQNGIPTDIEPSNEGGISLVVQEMLVKSIQSGTISPEEIDETINAAMNAYGYSGVKGGMLARRLHGVVINLIREIEERRIK